MIIARGKRTKRYGYDIKQERFNLGDYLQHVEDAPNQAHKVVEIFDGYPYVVLLWPNGARELYDVNFLIKVPRSQRRRR